MKRITAKMAADQDTLDSLRAFYGGSPEEAIQKFLTSQLCKLVVIEKVEIKRRYVKKEAQIDQ